MSPPKTHTSEDKLAALLATRNAAREALTKRIDQAKALTTPAALSQRVKQDLTHQARNMAYQAIEIAGDNRGVIAATASALLLWLMRRPALRGLEKLHASRAERQVKPHKTSESPAIKDDSV